jgi:acyl transferase domain-containing protein
MNDIEDGIAIIGGACRVPGASDLDAFWHNLVSGVDAIRTYTDAELRAAGVDEALLTDPRYVRAAGHLDGIDLFDAEFFGYEPAEAALIDPQHRLFLEEAWTALERAGCNGGDTRPAAMSACSPVPRTTATSCSTSSTIRPPGPRTGRPTRSRDCWPVSPPTTSPRGCPTSSG